MLDGSRTPPQIHGKDVVVQVVGSIVYVGTSRSADLLLYRDAV
jgi:hypothetical protein